MKYGVGPQDAGQKGSWKDVATLGAQMLPGSDIAREVGASDLEPTISEDIKNKRYMDALLKAISTAGDVGTGTGAIMMGTGAGAVPGAALIGASQLAKLAAKAARNKRIIFHTTDAKKGIQGKLQTGNDLGFHLGGNAEISRNAAITTRGDNKNLKTEEFELDAKPEEILTLKRKGGAFEPDDFADEMLSEKFITKEEHSKLFNNILDLEDKYGWGNKEYYQAANRMYKKLLKEKNIKAIKYFNEVDAGPNKLFKDIMAKENINDILAYDAILKGERYTNPRLKNLDLTDTGIDVKPADSYVIFDESVIKKVSQSIPIKISKSDRWDSAFQRTYGQGKVESAYKERIKQIDKANKEGKKIKDYELKLPDSETVLVENVALNPKILKNVQGVHGEHIVRDSGQKLKRLEKNIKEKGYKQKDPIQIYVREDGTPFINEGNHRVAEAIKNNRPIINARIHYKGGSEKVKGEFNPFNILPEEKATDISTSLNISAEDLTTYNKFENYLNTLQNKIQSLLKKNKLIGKAKGAQKVVDEGVEKVDDLIDIFHGTSSKNLKKIEEKGLFNPTGRKAPEADIGIHVATDPKTSNVIVKDSEDAITYLGSLNPNVKSLRIPDINRFSDPRNWKKEIDNLKLPTKLKNDFNKIYNDAIKYERKNEILGSDEYFFNTKAGKVYWLTKLREWGKNNNFNSFVYKNKHEGPIDKDSLMLLYPTQIKDKFSKVKDWSDPNPMKAKGGTVLKDYHKNYNTQRLI